MRIQTVLAVAVLASLALPAAASERRFTYTYESAVLPAGQVELEPWTTFRYGKELFYARFDERLEVEVGLTDFLQTALYLNFKAVAQDELVLNKPVRAQELEFGGVSSEWKLKLLDPTADPIGLALYVEGTLAPVEAELEAKVIVDKRFGDFVLAFNLVGETEFEYEEAGELGTEFVVQGDLGFAYLVTKQLGIGVEIRNDNIVTFDEGFEHSTFFAGPTISYAGDRVWAAFTVLPQLGTVYNHDATWFELHDHERMEARLVFGVHL